MEHNKNMDEARRARWLEVIDEEMTEVITEQEAFYRSVGVDPNRVYQPMDIMFDLRQALFAAAKPVDANKASFVLGQKRPLEGNRPGGQHRAPPHRPDPVAFLIDGRLYFEGEPLSSKSYTCKPQPEPAASAAPP